MGARLVFLGRLADVAGMAAVDCAVGALPETLPETLAALPAALAEALRQPRVKLALNGALVADAAAVVLAEGDELAFLPPVSGG